MNNNSKILIFIIVAFSCVNAEVNTCGETFLSKEDTISFVSSENNVFATQCIWSILPPGEYNMITFTYEDGNLDFTQDFLGLTVFQVHSTVEPEFYRITNDSTSTVNSYGSIVMLVFRTNQTQVRKEFRLRYSAKNLWPDERPRDGFMNSEDQGLIRYPEDGNYYNDNQLTTFLIVNPRFNSNEKILLEITDVDMDGCSGPFGEKCQCDKVKVYEILSAVEDRPCWLCNPNQEKVMFKLLEEGVCGSNGGFGFYSKNGFLVTFKSDRHDNQHRGFQMNWKNIDKISSPDPIPLEPLPGAVTTCGGILEGPSGVIEYKMNENYTPDEFCVWTIRADAYERISFRKEATQMVIGEDLITITAFDYNFISHGSIASRYKEYKSQLNLYYGGNETVSLNGQFAVVVFTSNNVNEKNGFRIYYNAYKSDYVYEKVHTDIAAYDTDGSLHLTYDHNAIFSSLVVAPNNTYTKGQLLSIQFTSVDFGDVFCGFAGLRLYEITPSNSDATQSGQLKIRRDVCHNDASEDIANRGFLGFLVVLQQYSGNGGHVTLNYKTL